MSFEISVRSDHAMVGMYLSLSSLFLQCLFPLLSSSSLSFSALLLFRLQYMYYVADIWRIRI